MQISNIFIDFIFQNWGVIVATIVTPLIGYLVGNRQRKLTNEKSKVEVESGKIENISDILTIYRESLEDLGKKLLEGAEVYKELELKYKVLVEKVSNYEKKIRSLEDENKMLISKLRTCEFCENNNK